MNTTLSKELIENMISNKYINTSNFMWDGLNVTFDNNGIKDEQYIMDNTQLLIAIKDLQNNNLVLGSKLDQLEKTHYAVLDRIFG